MRVHVVSDVHGNAEALARAGGGADALLVLGDLVEFVDYQHPARGILGEPHPQFHWARANGWAILTMVELLDVLPENFAGRSTVLDLLAAHAKGLAGYQSGTGLWHQLLDHNDSYKETSATAIYTYSIAHAINKGWLSAQAYAPMVVLGWNAVTTQVNAGGQVENVCVGTGMGFDPAFYYYRPVNVYAAHGYGPVIFAGAEVLQLVKNSHMKINDSAVQFYP